MDSLYYVVRLGKLKEKISFKVGGYLKDLDCFDEVSSFRKMNEADGVREALRLVFEVIDDEVKLYNRRYQRKVRKE